MSTSILDRQKGLPARLLTLLIGGDMLVFVAFAALGRASHGLTASNPFLALLMTAAPFAAAWALVAPPMWLFAGGTRTLESLGRWLAHSALTWLVAGPVGLALRALLVTRRPIVLSFAVVTMLVVWALLLIWRGLFWAIHRKLA